MDVGVVSTPMECRHTMINNVEWKIKDITKVSLIWDILNLFLMTGKSNLHELSIATLCCTNKFSACKWPDKKVRGVLSTTDSLWDRVLAGKWEIFGMWRVSVAEISRLDINKVYWHEGWVKPWVSQKECGFHHNCDVRVDWSQHCSDQIYLITNHLKES